MVGAPRVETCRNIGCILMGPVTTSFGSQDPVVIRLSIDWRRRHRPIDRYFGLPQFASNRPAARAIHGHAVQLWR